MVKKSVSVEFCSKLMKRPKNKHVIQKFFIIYFLIFENLTWSDKVIIQKRDHGFPVISSTFILQ